MTGVSSPLSTGGAGTVFEQHVGAMFLALLLIRGIPAVFRGCQVEEVSFQTMRLGWGTDDLLVACSSRNGPRRLAMQVRRNFTVGKSDGCKETIRRFWDDFNAERFDPDRDALILATLHHTENLEGLASLLECARSSPGPADFKDRLETPKLVSDAARTCYREIYSIVNNADPSGSAGEDTFWRFLRTVYVMFLDLTTDTAQQEATVTQLLALASGDADAVDAARAAWHEMVAVAADAAPRAKTLRRSDLPAGMLERYGAMPVTALQALTDHSATILDRIRSTIGDATTLPRTEVITRAAMALGDRVVALTGPPGAGKSALAKAVIQRHSGSRLCLSFRATDFAKGHIDDALPGPISGERFRLFVGAQEKVIIHVDGLERLLECPVRDAFGDLVAIAENCPNVSLVLTCRDTEMENAATALLGRSPLTCSTVEVPPLSAEEMERVGREIPDLVAPMSRRGLARIMSAPYVLDMAARMDWSGRRDVPADTVAFRKKWWSEVVRNDGEAADGMPERRERTLVDIAVRRARGLLPSVPTNEMDAGALAKLRRDGIVAWDGGLAAPAHDVIEDWAVIRWLESRAIRHEWAALPLAGDVGTHPAVRRGFRGWLRERLDTDAGDAAEFVLAAYGDDSLPGHFLDDMLISVLLSGSVGDFVSRQKDRLLADDARLLVRMIHLTRVACTKASGPPDGGPGRGPAPPEPEGEAWPVLLGAIDGSIERLLPEHYGQILKLLSRWAIRPQSPTMPEGAVPAVRVAYRLLGMAGARSDDTRIILEIIAGVPSADGGSFLGMVERAASKSEWRNIALGTFRDILMGRLGFPACRDFPKEMAEFVRSSCIPEGPDTDRIWTFAETFSPEFRFGLYPHASSDFTHFSSFRGPFWPLLRFHPDVGIRLVLDLVNHAGDWYGTKGTDPVPRIVVSVPGHVGVIQWADDRLWQAYRGASEVPHVIACALMALEHWLLKMCESGYGVGPLLLKILRESRSVMTTGVVASVCCAHPDLCGAVPMTLLKSECCIVLDRSRAEKEGDTPLGRYAATSREDRHYDDERRESNALPHRRRDLESLARMLEPQNREARAPDGDGMGRAAASDADKDCAPLQGRGIPGAEDLRAGAPALYDWGLKQWRQNSDESDAETWQQALSLARDAEPYAESDRVHFTGNGPPVVAAVCVRDHWEEMSAGERRWCAGALIAEVGRYSDEHHSVSALASSADSDSIAARSLPKILANDPGNRKILEAVARSLTHASPAVCLSSAKGVGEHLGLKHRDMVLQCAGAVAMLSNLLAGNEQRRPREGRAPAPGRPEGKQDAPELARRALADGSIDVEAELEDLDLAARRGRDSVPIMHMLGRAPDLPVTGRFVARMGRAVVDTWAEEYEVIGGPNYEFRSNATYSLAEIILSLPRTILDYCRPFLDAVDARPDRVASFVRSLVAYMDGSSAGRPFWDVWQAFADRTIKAPWISGTVSGDSKGAGLVRCMVFDMEWLKDSQHWAYLAGHEERVCEFVGRLPPTPHVLASFARYLYASGAGSNPAPLKVVAGHLRAGDPAGLLGNEDTVYCLAHMLQRYVYGRPAMLKKPALRKDTLLVLDLLVDAGSPAAYRMRDDFATPNVGKR